MTTSCLTFIVSFSPTAFKNIFKASLNVMNETHAFYCSASPILGQSYLILSKFALKFYKYSVEIILTDQIVNVFGPVLGWETLTNIAGLEKVALRSFFYFKETAMSKQSQLLNGYHISKISRAWLTQVWVGSNMKVFHCTLFKFDFIYFYYYMLSKKINLAAAIK